jgi:hypothetical protein
LLGIEFAIDEFVASIKENGLQEPIVLLDDAIPDGRNRYNACLAAGIDPMFVPFRGDDPVKFVIVANIQRRHLDASQRAMIAADIVTYQHGGDRKSDQSANLRLDKWTHAEAIAHLAVAKLTFQNTEHVFDLRAHLAEPAIAGALADRQPASGLGFLFHTPALEHPAVAPARAAPPARPAVPRRRIALCLPASSAPASLPPRASRIYA